MTMQIDPMCLLKEFRGTLLEKLGNKNTADRYYYALCNFFREYQIDDFSKITQENVLEALSHCKTKNYCAALKLGLKNLKEYRLEISLPAMEEMAEIQRRKRNRSLRPEKVIYIADVQEKIKRIRDKKLKYAYQLMMDSGLRTSETAALEKEDIQISRDGITVNVRHGKGDSNGLVTCLRDPYLEARLPKYLQSLPEGEKPFYEAITMKKKAGVLGLECHDLRRIAAITFRNGKMEERRHMKGLEIPTVPQIDEATKEFLRHKRFSTTKRYLYNRKLRVILPAEPEEEKEGFSYE